MKKNRKFMILASCTFFLLLLLICTVTERSNDKKKVYSGDHLYGSSLQVGVGQKGYDSPETAIENSQKKYQNEAVIFIGGTGNYSITFWLDGRNVVGEEVMKKGDKYYYIGNSAITFCREGQEEKKGFENTLKADVEQSVNIHSGFLKLNEKYSALPVWGIADDEKISGLIIEDQKVETCVPFKYDGKEYYLWFISDFSVYEEDDIKIEYKEEESEK